MKCKNVECEKETNDKNLYCSLTCRNVFVNKYLRNYDKYSNTCKQKKDEKEIEYFKNPKICPSCNKIIAYDVRYNTYCNSSCQASITNAKREYTWSDSIKKSIHKYLIENGIKKEGQIGVYEKECLNCKTTFLHKRNEMKYCSPNCTKEYRRRHMDEYQKYKQDCLFKFNLADYPNYFDFSLIEKYGWYSPTNKKNNLEGVSRDHMLSVREGFELGIDPKLISHPANCRLMKHTDNISKNKKSVITVEELLEKIKILNKKTN